MPQPSFSPSQSIACPVTEAELAQIDAIVARTGQTRTEWVQGLIRAALSETPVNIRHLTERVAQLEDRYRTMADSQLAQLPELQRQVQWLMLHLVPQVSATESGTPQSSGSADSSYLSGGLSEGVPSDERLMNPTPAIQTDPAVEGDRPLATAPSSRVGTSAALEDFDEDEPDEVLYAFLAAPPQENSPLGSQSTGGMATVSQNSTYASQSQASQSIYDMEDEPDEVLYDFLDERDRPF